MNEGVQLTGAGSKKQRRELDFYPTPPSATFALMNFLRLPICSIWEPASGSGHMSRTMESYGHTVISTDIRTDGVYGQTGIDYLKADRYKVDAIITNPPFSLSEEFIRKALSEADIVCMLLKSQYWHAKKRLRLFNEHTPDFVLPITWRLDFLFDKRKEGEKGRPTMECAWAVWDKRNRRGGAATCRYIPLSKP